MAKVGAIACAYVWFTVCMCRTLDQSFCVVWLCAHHRTSGVCSGGACVCMLVTHVGGQVSCYTKAGHYTDYGSACTSQIGHVYCVVGIMHRVFAYNSRFIAQL